MASLIRYVPSELRQLIERARLIAAARRWLRPAAAVGAAAVGAAAIEAAAIGARAIGAAAVVGAGAQPGYSHSQWQKLVAVGGEKAAAALGMVAAVETEEEDSAGDFGGESAGDLAGDLGGDLELCLADAAEALPHVTARVRSPAAAAAAAVAMLEAGGAAAGAAGAGAGLGAGWARVGSLELPKRILSEAVLLPRQHRALFASAPLRLTSGVLI